MRTRRRHALPRSDAGGPRVGGENHRPAGIRAAARRCAGCTGVGGLRNRRDHFRRRRAYAAASRADPRRSRSAFDTTDTDDRLIASAAIMGDSTIPNHGYRTPAAIGMPITL